MTLTELKAKAYATLTPLWKSVVTFETKYYDRNATYKAIPIRKLHLPIADKFDVWGRVLADQTGYALQILVEVNGTQYARSKGYGTGTTFDWRTVNLGTLGTDGEYDGPPNSFVVERTDGGGKIITF